MQKPSASTPAAIRKIRGELKKHGYDPRYYLGRDAVGQTPYIPYNGDENEAVWVRLSDGTTHELSGASNVVYSLIHGPARGDHKIFFPEDICVYL